MISVDEPSFPWTHWLLFRSGLGCLLMHGSLAKGAGGFVPAADTGGWQGPGPFSGTQVWICRGLKVWDSATE